MCENTSVALGTFDGLHKGHLAVIDSAVKTGEENGLKPVVMLFSSHPQNELTGYAPPELVTRENKNELIRERGAEIFEIDFKKIINLSKNEFIYDILIGKLHAKALSCGENYRFGKNAEGDTAFLKEICEKENIILNVVKMEKVGEEVVSSTSIRKKIENGEIEKANEMLSRFFSYNFTVVDGQHLGRKLGMPTINQYFPKGFVRPKNGVYSSVTFVDEKKYKSVTNIGTRPTVSDLDTVRSETHIIGLDENLYGKNPTVCLTGYMRNEKKFSSVEALTRQIERDINTRKESEC